MTSITLLDYDGGETTLNGTLQLAIQELLSNDFYYKLISNNDNALSFIIFKDIYTDKVFLRKHNPKETLHEDILNNYNISSSDLLFGD